MLKDLEGGLTNKFLNYLWNTREKFRNNEINKDQYESLICCAIVEEKNIPIDYIESIVSVLLNEF